MIEPNDLKQKFGELEEAVNETASSLKNKGVIAALVVVVALAVVFLVGRRKGTSVAGQQLEIYRIR